jgi:hypothetical protein
MHLPYGRTTYCYDLHIRPSLGIIPSRCSSLAARHGASFYLGCGKSFPNKLPGLGEIEELMKECLVQVGALKEGFVAPVAVALVTNSIFSADGFNTGLLPFFDYRQLFLFH